MIKIKNYFSILKKAVKQADKIHNLKLIETAYNFANIAHSNQKRLSGCPYISHPVSVAIILLELGMDTNSVIAGILHDVVEDTKISIETLKNKFGDSVATIVEGVTKFSTAINNSNAQEQQIENIRKMLLAMSNDVRVIIVKLADRLHNMRTAYGWPEKKQRSKALETMEIYAPLAQRLGMMVIKEELQDLALKILDPIAYDEISKMLKLKQKANVLKLNSNSYLKQLENKVLKKIQPIVSDVNISGRLKSHYALYFKIYVKGKNWNEVFDIYAIRIVVNTVLECYGVLGAVHSLFKPLQNRFKDYIATPKANSYQSLHTTVIDDGGIPFEVQIRTKQMQYIAEYGIAAHWKYKQKIPDDVSLDEKLLWVRRIIELQRDSKNADDFFHMFKTDLGSEEVFVFTPKGEVKSLPYGSTVIDFAYLIHSQVGNKMIGAKINGKAVPVETKIESNQIVEILTTKSKKYGPKRSWIAIAKTSEARNKIRSWLKKECRQENIKRGKLELKNELLRNDIKLNQNNMVKFVEKLAKFSKFNLVDDFYAAIGYGAVSLSKIVSKMKEIYSELKNVKMQPDTKIKLIKIKKNSQSVKVDGIGICSIKFSKCCNPVSDCKTIGYINKNKQISIHCSTCSNVIRIQNNVNRVNRFINVQFDESLKHIYLVNLKILAKNEGNIIGSINFKIISLRLKIVKFNAVFLNDGGLRIKLEVNVVNSSQLKNLVSSLKKIKGVVFVGLTTKF